MTTATKFSAPEENEYAEYYHRYIRLAPDSRFLEEFRNQPDQLDELLAGLNSEESNQRHEPYTWSLKQVVGHLIDCERIFSTRALRIGVGDQTPIPGIDQNIYVENLDYESIDIGSLLAEFRSIRESNVLLAQRMSAENLNRKGIASDNAISAKANFYIMAGHFVYHYRIMQSRLN